MYCLQPQSCGVICYAAIDTQHTLHDRTSLLRLIPVKGATNSYNRARYPGSFYLLGQFPFVTLERWVSKSHRSETVFSNRIRVVKSKSLYMLATTLPRSGRCSKATVDSVSFRSMVTAVRHLLIGCCLGGGTITDSLTIEGICH